MPFKKGIPLKPPWDSYYKEGEFQGDDIPLAGSWAEPGKEIICALQVL